MLGPVIGELLPLTLPIAISPLTIVAVILMLLASHARRASVGFLLGWGIGVAVPVVIFVILGGLLPPKPAADGPEIVRGVIQLILAVLLILLAVKQWRGRPAAGESPSLPKWMSAIDSFGFARALGLGLLLALPRPKNLVMAAAAGVTIGGAGLSAGSAAIATAVFILCAVSTVLIPVVAYLFAAERLRAPLEALRSWLINENAVIMSLLLLVLGVLMLGKGIAAL